MIVTLVLDEMKIREDLVFSKASGEIIGFVDLEKGALMINSLSSELM